MIEKLADNIIGRAKSVSDNFDSRDSDIYKYGIEILISSVLNAALVLALGALLNSFAESLIFLFVFIITRIFTGGYHADSYFKCNFYFCLCFVSVLTITYLTRPVINVFMIVMLVFSSVFIVAALAPIDNPNKIISAAQKRKLRLISIGISIIFGISGGALAAYNVVCGLLITYTLTTVAILMIAAKIKLNGGKKDA